MDLFDCLKASSWLTEWLALIGVFVTAVSALFAVVKYFNTKKREKHKKLVRIRLMLDKICTQIGKVRSYEKHKVLELKESIIDNIDTVIIDIAEIKDIPEYIFCLRQIISNHYIWLGDDLLKWIQDLDYPPEENDREWASGVIEGMFHVVNDGVLNDSDKKYLYEGFWTEITSPYFDDNNNTEISNKPKEDDFKRASEHWIDKSQKENARIKALVDYRVFAEHALAFMLKAEFNDNKMNNLPRSEKFEKSAYIVWFGLLEKFQEQLAKMCK